MIKKIFILIAIALVVNTANGQAFEKGDFGMNLGLGFGFIGDLTPALHFSGEFGVIPISDVGTISFGGNADFNVYNFDALRTHVAARAAFHLGFLNTEKFDVYAGFASGVRLYSYSNIYSRVYFDEFIGARMMTGNNFGFFAEAGYGVTSLKVGFTWIF